MNERRAPIARMRSAAVMLGLCIGLSACALLPSYQRPELDLPGPEGTTAAAERVQAQRQAMAEWWTRFGDPVLNRLIQSAMQDNLKLALQAARIREARAQLGLAQAKFYPTLGAQIKASRKKASLSLAPGSRAAGVGDRYSTTFSVAATLSYELNLFAALARHEAAQAKLLASAFSRDALRLAIISDVVATYMSLRATQRKIRITKAVIETRERGVELAEKRYQYGTLSKLDLLRKRSLLASARARLPKLKQQASKLESALAILVGKTPSQIMNAADIEPAPLMAMQLPGDLPELLPSVLVSRRPDIRAAEAALVAADARVSVAKAQYFPSINLSALIGSAAMTIGALFEAMSETASMTGVVTAPILTFGRINARVDTAQARRQQAKIQYRRTVRRAFKEVRNALVSIKTTHQRVRATRQQVEALKKTLVLARKRYEVGSVGLLSVLEVQRQLYQAKLALSSAIRDRFVATANLFKALGGGWTDKTDSVPENVDTEVPGV